MSCASLSQYLCRLAGRGIFWRVWVVRDQFDGIAFGVAEEQRASPKPGVDSIPGALRHIKPQLLKAVTLCLELVERNFEGEMVDCGQRNIQRHAAIKQHQKLWVPA